MSKNLYVYEVILSKDGKPCDSRYFNSMKAAKRFADSWVLNHKEYDTEIAKWQVFTINDV